MFSLACLFISSAILYFIVRYRVHIHVTYTQSAKKTQALNRTQGHENATPRDYSRTRRSPRASDDHQEITPIEETDRARVRRFEGPRDVRGMASNAQQSAAPNVGQSIEQVSGPRHAGKEGRSKSLGSALPLLNLEFTARRNDLVSALKHQGCTPAAAKQAATKAMRHQDEPLAVALRRAIDYAREAA